MHVLNLGATKLVYMHTDGYMGGLNFAFSVVAKMVTLGPYLV